MTRFWITLEQGVRLVIRGIEQMHGGEIFVPKIPSMNLMEMAGVIAPGCDVEAIGIRPGEKLHEVLISEDEARQAIETEDMFVIQPAHPWWRKENWKQGRALPEGFRYSSDNNPQWLSAEDLYELMAESFPGPVPLPEEHELRVRAYEYGRCAIIQARMGSTRLPGKVLMDLGGETVLARVVRRLQRAGLIDEIVVATTTSAADNAIVSECERFSVAVFRGQENDVLDRYYHAAKWVDADAIVRITSDCPLIDPEITDNTIRAFVNCKPDYASNALQRTYPRGLDTEVIAWEALVRAWEGARFFTNVHMLRRTSTRIPIGFTFLQSQVKLITAITVGRSILPEDLAFIRTIYERMDNDDSFSWRDVLALLESEPQLTELNREVRQKALQEG